MVLARVASLGQSQQRFSHATTPRVGGLVNTRGQTLSHCSCDSRQKYKFMMSHELRCRFRACLTVARTPSADAIGRIFFNLLGTPCFEWRPAECGAWPARLRPWLGCRTVISQPRSYRPSSHTNNTRARDIIWGYLAF